MGACINPSRMTENNCCTTENKNSHQSQVFCPRKHWMIQFKMGHDPIRPELDYFCAAFTSTLFGLTGNLLAE